MGQINNSYGPLAKSLDHATDTPSSSGAEQLREIRHTVTKVIRTLNEAGIAGKGRELTFSLDATTKRPVTKVIDTESREVVAQWPSEYVLRMAEELNQLKRNSG